MRDWPFQRDTTAWQGTVGKKVEETRWSARWGNQSITHRFQRLEEENIFHIFFFQPPSCVEPVQSLSCESGVKSLTRVCGCGCQACSRTHGEAAPSYGDFCQSYMGTCSKYPPVTGPRNPPSGNVWSDKTPFFLELFPFFLMPLWVWAGGIITKALIIVSSLWMFSVWKQRQLLFYKHFLVSRPSQL